MERKILFCNVAWMKNYTGKTDDDKPFNGGKYIDEVGSGGEMYNFLDENGKCYGAVMVGGKMALQNHYKGVKAKDSYVDDVLVVWVATNEKKKTRIVGWYKNARVYREVNDMIFFTEQSENRYYNIEADAMDCYLLPVEERTFKIDRANEVGPGMGIGQSNIWYADSNYAKANIVPAVIKYIEEYDGKYSNFVYNNEWINKDIEKIEYLSDFEKLYEEGNKRYNEKKYYDALIHFKAAERIDQPIELLNKLGETLLNMLRCDEAIDIYNRIINLEGEDIYSLISLRTCYDWNQDKEKTIEYCNKIIDFQTDSYDDIENKIFSYYILFDIYIYERKFKKAEEVIKILEVYLRDTAKYSKDDLDGAINHMINNLEYHVENLVK